MFRFLTNNIKRKRESEAKESFDNAMRVIGEAAAKGDAAGKILDDINKQLEVKIAEIMVQTKRTL